MPKKYLAGRTKFYVYGKYVIRLYTKRVFGFLGITKISIHTEQELDNLASKYCPYPPIPLTDKDIEWAQAISKELGLY